MTTPVELARHFDRELENLKQDLLRMAALAETAVGKSVESVTNRDSDRAREVIIDDITLNRMELAIEEQAFKLLALRQHGSQVHIMSWFLDSFVRSNELFAPVSVPQPIPAP